MLPLIESKKAEIAALCRQHHVRRLDVFGSAARGADPHPERSEAQSRDDPVRSDIDFLVEFEPASSRAKSRDDPEAMTLDTFLGLKDSLESLLGRAVDLVEPAGVRNPYIKASIERSRESVFAA